MSANNQVLLKKHKDKWLVFDNVQAESWDKTNTIDASEGREFDNLEDATEYANSLSYDTEYGVGDYLIKDGASVTILNDL